MSLLHYARCVKFNQCFRLDDIRTGFNCFAYSILFYNYVIAHRLLFPTRNVDYARLEQMLANYKDKTRLQKTQSNFVCLHYSDNFKLVERADNAQLFNTQLLLLHNSKESDDDNDLESLLFSLLNDREDKKFGNLYGLDLYSTQKFLGLPLYHSVSLYLASSNELHFFDANSGAYIIYLGENVSVLDLKDTVIDLIFNQNIIMKHAFNPLANNIDYSLTTCEFDFDNANPVLKELILNYLKQANPLETSYGVSNLSENDKEFLERLFFVIELQRSMHEPTQSKNLFTYFKNYFETPSFTHNIIDGVQSFLPFTKKY